MSLATQVTVTSVADQVGLFAFDAAGMAPFTAPALLDGSEREAGRAFRRAAVLEAVRPWPTTPAILRDTTEATRWRRRRAAAGRAAAARHAAAAAASLHAGPFELRFALSG